MPESSRWPSKPARTPTPPMISLPPMMSLRTGLKSRSVPCAHHSQMTSNRNRGDAGCVHGRCDYSTTIMGAEQGEGGFSESLAVCERP